MPETEVTLITLPETPLVFLVAKSNGINAAVINTNEQC